MIKNLDDEEFLFVYLLCGETWTLVHKERLNDSSRPWHLKAARVQNAIIDCVFDLESMNINFGPRVLERNVFFAYAHDHGDGLVFVNVFNDAVSACSDRNDMLNVNRF